MVLVGRVATKVCENVDKPTLQTRQHFAISSLHKKFFHHLLSAGKHPQQSLDLKGIVTHHGKYLSLKIQHWLA